MKRSLDHLPLHKQEQIRAIADLLGKHGEGVEMVILYGSYARGDWVEDPAGGYISDLDFLVITRTARQANKPGVWTKLQRRARRLSGPASVSLIVHDLKDVNTQLERGYYFFSDIKREGVLLYSAGRHELAQEKASTPAERQAYAQACFDEYFGKANRIFRFFEFGLQEGYLKEAAFELHQATETYYKTVLLVFTAYRPKAHDIEELGKKCGDLHPAFRDVFPTEAPDEERRFKLLRAAYVDARYNMKYRITREELEALAAHVRDLAARTERACTERIAAMQP